MHLITAFVNSLLAFRIRESNKEKKIKEEEKKNSIRESKIHLYNKNIRLDKELYELYNLSFLCFASLAGLYVFNIVFNKTSLSICFY